MFTYLTYVYNIILYTTYMFYYICIRVHTSHYIQTYIHTHIHTHTRVDDDNSMSSQPSEPAAP